ncbi:MAG: hypothetical protein WKF84_26765 [Pyrinomonadaceae bacterium]
MLEFISSSRSIPISNRRLFSIKGCPWSRGQGLTASFTKNYVAIFKLSGSFARATVVTAWRVSSPDASGAD